MMKIRFIAVLLIAIFINPYVICANDRDSALFATHSMNCVWRVYSNGGIEKVLCFQDTPFWYRGNIFNGANSPCISPDQRYVAVIRQDDLWLFEPATRNLIRLTQVAKPYTKKHLSIEVNTKSWSWDSRKLLYSVSSGNPGSGDDGFDRKVRPAKYGFYIYDVKDKSKTFISESTYISNFDKLFPNFNRVTFDHTQDGTILINGNKINEKLDLGHIDISRDGQWLVARIEEPQETFGKDPRRKNPQSKDPRSQIVKIDLKNYNIIPITPLGTYAEYQWPKFSPSGKHILYEREIILADKRDSIDNIGVDGKNIYTPTGEPKRLTDCFWIDDNTIAFIGVSMNNELEIIIIDSVTGKIKGQHKIGKAH